MGKFSLLYNLVANFLDYWGILFAFQSCPLALYIQKNLSLLCHPVFHSLLGSFISVLGEVLERCLQPSSYSLKVHCSFMGFLLHLLLCFVDFGCYVPREDTCGSFGKWVRLIPYWEPLRISILNAGSCMTMKMFVESASGFSLSPYIANSLLFHCSTREEGNCVVFSLKTSFLHSRI